MDNKINKIHQDILNNNYKIKKFNKCDLPDKIDSKNALIYFIDYVWFEKIKDPYFKELLDFVCIPKNTIDFETLDDFINATHYIKYNINNTEIKLLKTTEDISKEIIQEVVDNITDDIEDINTEDDTDEYTYDFLKRKTVKELNIICKENKLKGYSKLKKNKKILFIMKKLNIQENVITQPNNKNKLEIQENVTNHSYKPIRKKIKIKKKKNQYKIDLS